MILYVYIRVVHFVRNKWEIIFWKDLFTTYLNYQTHFSMIQSILYIVLKHLIY